MRVAKVSSRLPVCKILVIDDDPTGTELLITLLGLDGFQGYGVENWDDPLSEVVARAPDLVMIDVRLSGQDGLVLLKQLRNHPIPQVADTPVLMMSAENHKLQSRAAGANGFVEKPFDWDTLRRAIERIMEGVLKN
jgi:DNA-binding response OmpR family regulator